MTTREKKKKKRPIKQKKQAKTNQNPILSTINEEHPKNTRKLVELDRVIHGSGSEARRVGTNGEGSDAVAVMAEDLRSAGGKKRVVDGDGWVGRGGRHQVKGLLVPQDGAEGAAPIVGRGSGRLVGLMELH